MEACLNSRIGRINRASTEGIRGVLLGPQGPDSPGRKPGGLPGSANLAIWWEHILNSDLEQKELHSKSWSPSMVAARIAST